METRSRTLTKAIIWQLLGLLTMTVVGLLVTGSVLEGGAVAGTNAMIGLATYIFYERVWARINWGRRLI